MTHLAVSKILFSVWYIYCLACTPPAMAPFGLYSTAAACEAALTAASLPTGYFCYKVTATDEED